MSKRRRHNLARAEAFGVPYDPSVTFAAVYRRDRGLCQVCKRRTVVMRGPASSDDRATIDHVIPMSKGGGHVWENVQLCCYACNQAKADAVRR